MYSTSDLLDTTPYIHLIQHYLDVATYRSDTAWPLAGSGAFAKYAKAEHWNECDRPSL